MPTKPKRRKVDGSSLPPPDTPPKRQTVFLHAARSIDPHHQGQFDALCGLYAIINAVRLAVALHRPLSRQESRSLFRHGVGFLRDAGKLAPAIQTGMELGLWQRLTAQVCERASIVTESKITPRRPLRRRASREEIFTAIAGLIADQTPAMILLDGAYDHYTVVCGLTPNRIRLFDSSGCCWVNINTCGTGHELPRRRHQIDSASVIAIAVSPNAAK